MAIIKCPECNSQISSTTSKCIHCGCEFKVCPECQCVYLSTRTDCPDCGYSNQHGESTKDFYENKTLDDVIYEWEKEVFYIKESFLNKIAFALIGISAILIICAVTSVFGWKNGEQLDAIARYGSMLSSTKTLLVFAAISLTFGIVVFLIKNFIRVYSLKIWTSAKNYDLLPLIDKYLSFGFSNFIVEDLPKKAKVIENTIKAKCYEKTPTMENKEKYYVFSRLIAWVIAIIMIFTFLVKNAGLYIQYLMFEEGYTSFNVEKLWMPVVGVAIIYFGKLVFERINDSIKDSLVNWVKTNLPYHTSTYIKYVRELDKLVTDRNNL